MQTKQDKPQNAAEVVKFFDWAFKNGQKMAAELDYVPDARRAWSSSSPTPGRRSSRTARANRSCELIRRNPTLSSRTRISSSSSRRKTRGPRAVRRGLFFGRVYHVDHFGRTARPRSLLSLAGAQAHAAARAARRGAVAGLAVRAHDDVLRAVRAADAGRHHRRADVDGDSGVPEVRVRILRHRRLGSGEAQFRRACPDLRNARHLGDRAADRRAGELRHRVVPHRDVSGLSEAAAGHRGRVAGGDSVDHLRHVGALRFRAGVRRLRPADC